MGNNFVNIKNKNVRARWIKSILLGVAFGLLGGGVALALAKLKILPIEQIWALPIGVGCALLAWLATWLLLRRTDKAIAKKLDRKFGLSERVQTMLEYEKAMAKITTLSVEPNGWGMRRFAVFGSKATVEIKPIELNVKMIKSADNPDSYTYSDKSEEIQVEDVPGLSRYDEMVKDLYLAVIGEKENPYSYEHELAVQRTLYKVTGEN